MKKITVITALIAFTLTGIAYAQAPAPLAADPAVSAQPAAKTEEAPKQIIGGFGNGLGYPEQFNENMKRGGEEIVNAPEKFAPSFKEQEITKLNAPFFGVADTFFGAVLGVTNVMDSVCRGIWRIIVAPVPVVQKVQP